MTIQDVTKVEEAEDTRSRLWVKAAAMWAEYAAQRAMRSDDVLHARFEITGPPEQLSFSGVCALRPECDLPRGTQYLVESIVMEIEDRMGVEFSESKVDFQIGQPTPSFKVRLTPLKLH